MLQETVYNIRLNRSVVTEIKNTIDMLLLLHPPVVTVLFSYTYIISTLRQTRICIVLAQENTVFRTRSKHAVRFINALCREVINQYTDITLVSIHHERLLTRTE